MNYAPIVLFAYNRLWHINQTISALRLNELAAESDLIIFSDAPKSPEAIEKVKEVRAFLYTINGFKSVTILERSVNFGLAKSIIEGVTEILKKNNCLIVLEDDLVTSPFFLKYMNEALQLYENDKEVISIHGYIYPLKKQLPGTFFIKGADCLGWATWRRSWNLFESNGQKLLDELVEKKLTGKFDFNGAYPYTDMLRDQISGYNSSWAVRWYAVAFLNNCFTLYPGRSLINHIYNDEQGTHCGETAFLNTRLTDKPIRVEKLPIEENLKARQEIEKWFRSLTPSLTQRIRNKMPSGFSDLRKRLKIIFSHDGKA
jgi:hypothetical protein